jgi:predicted DNA-binding transcriptional regulator AlpA
MMSTEATRCVALEETMARPEITGRKIGGRKLESREQEAEAGVDEADDEPPDEEPPDEVNEAARIAGKKLLTFDDLVALGHPYTRQHTKRLEDAGVFPKRVKPGGESSNFVAWIADEYYAYLEALAAARPTPSTRRPPKATIVCAPPPDERVRKGER